MDLSRDLLLEEVVYPSVAVVKEKAEGEVAAAKTGLKHKETRDAVALTCCRSQTHRVGGVAESSEWC
jgi:hypothetical protein